MTHHRRSHGDDEHRDPNSPADYPTTNTYVYSHTYRVVEHQEESDTAPYKVYKLRPAKEVPQVPLELSPSVSPPPPVPGQDYHASGKDSSGFHHLHFHKDDRQYYNTAGKDHKDQQQRQATSPISGVWHPSSITGSTGRLHYLPPPPKEGTFFSSYRNGEGGKVMGSQKMYANGSLAIRILVLVLILIAMILIMTAPWVCFWRNINGQQTSREICPGPNGLFPMNIDRWSSALHFQMRGQNVWGQLAIIILSILFVIPPLIFSCIFFTTERNLSFSQLIADGVAILAFLIFGAFEVWYATGYDHMGTFIRQIGGGTFSGCAGIPACEVGFVVRGWVVAATFYFLSAILYVIDAALVFLKRDSSTGRRVILQRSQQRGSY